MNLDWLELELCWRDPETRRVRYLDLANGVDGLVLREWRPMAPAVKEGGVWRDNPLAHGRTPQLRRRANIIDTMTLDVSRLSVDRVATTVAFLRRTLEQGADYWIDGSTVAYPVWLRARAAGETNVRYAVVYDYQAPEDGDMADEGIASQTGARRGYATWILTLEHGPWLAEEPGSGVCVPLEVLQVEQALSFWEARAGFVPAGVPKLLGLSSGILLAIGDVGCVWRSTDGAVWNCVNLPNVLVTVADICVGADGYVYVVCDDGTDLVTYRTSDDGATWAAAPNGVIAAVLGGPTVAYLAPYLPDAPLLLTTSIAAGAIIGGWTYDPAVGWTLQASYAVPYAPVYPPAVMEDPSVYWAMYAPIPEPIVSATPTTLPAILRGWTTFVWTGADCLVTAWCMLGNTLAGVTTTRKIARARYPYTNWTFIDPGFDVYALFQDSNGRIHAGSDNGTVYVSQDGGFTWRGEAIAGADVVFHGFAEDVTTQTVYVVGTDTIAGTYHLFARVVEDRVMGQERTCDDPVLITNHMQWLNLSTAYVYDDSAGTYASILPAAAFPVNLFPAVPAVGDAVMFTIDGSLQTNGNPTFASLVFNIDDILVPTAAVVPTFEWQFSTGAGTWAALDVTDNTAGTSEVPFTMQGLRSVHWHYPDLGTWVAATYSGITGLWVRCVITAIGGGIAQVPTQDEPDIYTLAWPYVDIADDAVTGDLPALLHLKALNVGDKDGPGGDDPDMYCNRIVIGSRSLERGELFSAYINLSDEQLPPGIEIDIPAAVDTAYANATFSVTGRMVLLTPASAMDYTTRFSIDISGEVAAQYYGTYHAFLRVRRTGGDADDYAVRLQFVTPWGGATFTTESQYVDTTYIWQSLDFGEVSIPASDTFGPDDLPRVTRVFVQVATSGAAIGTLAFYELVLIPVDEWSADICDVAELNLSQLQAGTYLDVDSITYPKREMRARVIGASDDSIWSIYRSVGPQPAVLRPDKAQRIWFYFERDHTVGAGHQRALPQASFAISAEAVARYSSLRGDR